LHLPGFSFLLRLLTSPSAYTEKLWSHFGVRPAD